MREIAIGSQLQVSGRGLGFNIRSGAQRGDSTHHVVSRFSAVGVAGEDQLSLGGSRIGIQPLCRCYLFGSQAVRSVTGLALQYGGIEFTDRWIRNEVVLYAIE